MQLIEQECCVSQGERETVANSIPTHKTFWLRSIQRYSWYSRSSSSHDELLAKGDQGPNVIQDWGTVPIDAKYQALGVRNEVAIPQLVGMMLAVLILKQ